ncbi:MAG: hypothetical protein L0Y70_17670 [Gemmataceae bacterium]|nr:hypothetical protein [Gemmataceae bacterium]
MSVQRKTRFGGGANRMVFKGVLQVEGERVVLAGRFLWPTAVKIAVALMVGFLLLLAAVGVWAAFQDPLVGLIMTLGSGVLAALIWSSPRFSRKDVLWLSDFFANALCSKKSPAIAEAMTRKWDSLFLVQLAFALAAICYIAWASIGITPIQKGPNLVEWVREGPWVRTLMLLNALVSAGVVYGIHRRWLFLWRIGLFALPLGAIGAIVPMMQAIDAALPANQPEALRWFLFAFIGVSLIAVTVYWTMWWKKQKKHFFDAGPGREF